MREFLKGRWFPLVAAIAFLLGAIFVMSLFGWRFTYAPELENSWDAVSSVAGWASVSVSIVSVVASFLAIWFAIQVPKKIAKQQDRIALFEKRYQLFIMLATWKYLAEQIASCASNNKEAQRIYSIIYEYTDVENKATNPLEKVVFTYRYIVNQISQVYYLYPVCYDVHPKLLSLINLTSKILLGNNFEELQNQLKEVLNSKEIATLFDIMENELKISQ